MSAAGPKVRAVQVVIGVDDKHVAVAIDQQGVRLAEHHAPATSYGYGELEPRDLGEIRGNGFLRCRTGPVPDRSRLQRRRGQSS